VSYIFDGSNWDLTDPTSIPNLFLQHLSITLISMAIGLVIAFAISLLVIRYTRWQLTAITTAGILYTLPSLALMAALIPLTGLAPTTVIIPLVAYTQVVLIRNIVAALQAVDPALVEVGRAMGMTRRQTLLRVQLPLALPVIVAGVRVATVTTIGIATIAPFFGVYTLGFLITQGFNLSDLTMVSAGAILCGGFAIAADLLLLALQQVLGRGQQVAPA
jgi:osmoprotectant transport system permease protein